MITATQDLLFTEEEAQFKALIKDLMNRPEWPSRDELLNLLELPKDFYTEVPKFRNFLELWKLREAFICDYSFALPCQEALQIIKKYSPIVEIGAGSGFWAYLLSKAGCDIIATDKNLDKIHNVHQIEASEAINKYPTKNIFCCWPDYNDEWSSNFLNLVKNQIVIYIGEFRGCTANDKFHDLLDEAFELVEEFPIPQWYGIHDRLFVYKRK
jgi:hypothetical protein